jgi:hypothetical protein
MTAVVFICLCACMFPFFCCTNYSWCFQRSRVFLLSSSTFLAQLQLIILFLQDTCVCWNLCERAPTCICTFLETV